MDLPASAVPSLAERLVGIGLMAAIHVLFIVLIWQLWRATRRGN